MTRASCGKFSRSSVRESAGALCPEFPAHFLRWSSSGVVSAESVGKLAGVAGNVANVNVVGSTPITRSC